MSDFLLYASVVALFLVCILVVLVILMPVSYTHLTLPTKP
jgi:hypothetical protein